MVCVNRSVPFAATLLAAATVLSGACRCSAPTRGMPPTPGTLGRIGTHADHRAPPEGPPEIAAPRKTWPGRSASQVFGDAGVAVPPGVMLDCATYDADLDPISGANGTVAIGVVRARTSATPPTPGRW